MAEKDTQELDFTPIEGERPVPVGWRILFWGLVVFGAWYLWAYSPAFSGWSQVRDLESGGGSGVNVLATILFTALAVVAAVAIVFAMSRRKPAGSPRSAPSTGAGPSGSGPAGAV
jgi:hypothetical protein